MALTRRDCMPPPLAGGRAARRRLLSVPRAARASGALAFHLWTTWKTSPDVLSRARSLGLGEARVERWDGCGGPALVCVDFVKHVKSRQVDTHPAGRFLSG